MPVTANASGVLDCKFTIPAGIPSGKKRVSVVGEGGSFGETFFEGKGEIWQENRHTTTNFTTVTNTSTTDYYVNNVGVGWYGWNWYYYPYSWYYNPYYSNWYWGWYGCGYYDPLAQTFRLEKTSQLSGVELFVRAKGDTDITVQVRTTQNGVPTNNLLSTAVRQVSGINVGAWNTWEFPEPVLLTGEEEYCIVVLCNDADAELAVAELGKWDNNAQKWVTTQPYTVGTLLSSSNASSWTVHQDKDLSFRLLTSNFATTTKTITLGTIALEDTTDLALAAEHLVPSSASRVSYHAELPGGGIVSLTPGVGAQLPAPVTGNAVIKATLTGTATESPIVAPGAQLVHGEVKPTATYVSRAIEAGTNVKVVLVIDAKIPTGATVTAEWKGTDALDTWQAFPAPTSKALTNEWAELTYTQTAINESMIQVRLTMTGATEARPLASNLRLYTA